MVVPFASCRARPDGPEGEVFLLSEHLLAVARANGCPAGDSRLRLGFFAGLVHDAGKARLPWQKRLTDPSRARAFHSPLGSLVFAYGAACLSSEVNDLDPGYIARTCRDIADHHGTLDSLQLGEPPWLGNLDLAELAECDLDGMFEFVRINSGLELTSAGLRSWYGQSALQWDSWCRSEVRRVQRELDRAEGPRYRLAIKRCLRIDTGRLIWADRSHAGQLEPRIMCASEAEAGRQKLAASCRDRAADALAKGADPLLVEARTVSAEEVCQRFLSQPQASIYTLRLPTGLGKTLTSLRVGLEAVARGDCQRVIYAAPYLAILSQATGEIRASTGLDVLEHHHLSALTKSERDGEQEPKQDEYDSPLLATESWQGAIVTTTFNQLLGVLFPRRAQQSMRWPALERAFLIIDEPQIMNGPAWTLTLAAIEAAADKADVKTLITTATVPSSAVSVSPVDLTPSIEVPDRYVVSLLGEMDEVGLASRVVTELETNPSVAVVMNTIADAADLYRRLAEVPDTDVLCLTGAMTPIHKALQIERVQKLLESGQRVLVVSTQVLEAGVDLSFRTVFRARPLLPSIVQAAGRVNRHGEKDLGHLFVVDFRRGGEVDTRPFVYRDRAARQTTDQLLEEVPTWAAGQSAGIISEYYRRLCMVSPDAACLDRLEAAAMGDWSQLGGVSPFETVTDRVDVFVPWPGPDQLPKWILTWFSHFGIGDPQELWDRYLQPGYCSGLEFDERKRFMALLGQFVAPVSRRAAEMHKVAIEDRQIAMLASAEMYDDELGLAGISPDDFNCRFA